LISSYTSRTSSIFSSLSTSLDPSLDVAKNTALTPSLPSNLPPSTSPSPSLDVQLFFERQPSKSLNLATSEPFCNVLPFYIVPLSAVCESMAYISPGMVTTARRGTAQERCQTQSDGATRATRRWVVRGQWMATGGALTRLMMA
jgi:hypothetical protein